VLGQAVFLLAANAAAFLGAPSRAAGDRVGKAVDAANALTQRWADLTGQPQSWGLFAPDVTAYVPFVTLDLRWNEGPPRRLPSRNAPADRQRFFRLGNFRFRRFESAIDLAPVSGRPFDPAGEEWRRQLASAVAERRDLLRAYLRWRLEAFRRETDLPPPAEVILSMHLYRIPAPPGPDPWDWDDLGTYPVARWRPGRPGLDAYDPRTDDFGPAFGGGR
jgi:hypothetical protein